MRKVSYLPQGPQEEFIVPLLRDEIRRALSDLRDALENNRHTKLNALDCGCGNQPFREAIESIGFNYTSLDLAQNSLNTVDIICSLDAPNNVFRGIVGNAFDLVLATEVLEHISDWHSAFRNLSGCTAADGYVLLTAPFFYPLHEEPFDYCRPTIHYFAKIAEQTGFTLVYAKKLGSAIDIIGTTLGASRIILSDTRSFRTRIMNKLILRLQQLVFDALLRHRLSLHATGESIYLSNVVILKRNANA